jgi:hypothetical protein
MTHALHNSLVRILNGAGKPVGVGFLAAPQVIVTCAHVIEQAVGDSTEVTFDFPLLAPAEHCSGRVLIREDAADIAAIEPRSLPRGVAPVRLVQSADLWGHPFRAFGCPAGYDGGVWASGVLRDRTAEGWLHIEDTKETGFAVQPGFSGGPVWDERLEGVVGMVVAAERSPQVKAAFCVPVSALLQTLPMLAERAMPPNPYRGLHYFREQDAALFFGREAFSERLLQAVTGRPLTAVVGASGAGKSSVVFAGLLVYCLESLDNPGLDLFSLRLDPASLTERHEPDLLGGLTAIHARTVEGRPLKFIPYFLWGNRGASGMTVWVRLPERPSAPEAAR